jgi:hypothetical protein
VNESNLLELIVITKRLFAILACTFAAQAAQADVLYSWHETRASPTMVSDMRLELVFSDAAVAAGRLVLDINNPCRDARCIDPQASLLSLRYWVEDGGRSRNIIDYRAGAAPKMFGDMIRMSLNFLPDGFLGGEIRANNGESDFHLASVGRDFTVMAARSDQGPCGMAAPVCYGSQGRLRQAAIGEVPEPASWLVLGAGVLAAGAARRLRRRS